MYPIKVVIFVLIAVIGSYEVTAKDKEVTDEEYSRFPRLFHLDEYESCLAAPGGLYCAGTFYVKPLREPHPLYDSMKGFSEDPHNLNHTLLHRGYCVSSRCGLEGGDGAQRFQTCAARWGRKQGYRLMLQELRYCRTHEQKLSEQTRTMDVAQRVFLAVVCGILLLNAIGTIYDLTADDCRKSRVLTAWSIRANWPHLVGPYSDGDPRLAAVLPVEACRVLLMLLVIFTHTGVVHDMLYLQNPRLVEQMSHHPVMMLLQNGTSVIQIFILLSSYLMAQHLLRMERQPSFFILPKLVMKRILRIAPVYLLVLGFAATWWAWLRDGPMWAHAVGAESQVCRDKFWSHALFINNFFDSKAQCLLQTWFVAVEMQLYVVACVVSLCLLRIRRLALPILGAAFLLSCVLNWAMAHASGWKPLFLVSVPENIRTLFRNEPSFSEFYARPLGSLPAMIIGLLMAHLHDEVNRRGFNPAAHKWLIMSCQMVLPLMPCWTSGGYLLRDMRSPLSLSLFMAVERPGLALMAAILLFGTQNNTVKKESKKTKSEQAIKDKISSTSSTGFLQHVFCWRAWYPLGRASLSALMVHWCVLMVLLAGKLTPITTSALDMV